MRDRAWYLLMLKGKTKEWAYNFITFNLKAPSSVYEAQTAYAVYKEVFGIDFASPEEMKAVSAQQEIERLKEENEKLRIAAKQTPVVHPANGQSELEPPPDNKVLDPLAIYKTKDEFKKVHPEIKGIGVKWAWAKYAKENGLTE